MREDPVELVQAVVIHHQLPFAGRGMLDGDLRTELVGVLLLEAQDVRVASIFLTFRRGRLTVATNVSAPEFELPPGARILLASDPAANEGRVPPDTTVWFTE